MTLSQGHTTGSWTTILWGIDHPNPVTSDKLMLGHKLLLCVQCDLNLTCMTLGPGHEMH